MKRPNLATLAPLLVDEDQAAEILRRKRGGTLAGYLERHGCQCRAMLPHGSTFARYYLGTDVHRLANERAQSAFLAEHIGRAK